MSDDIPEDLVPDDPQHVGKARLYEDTQIYGAIFPPDSGEERDPPVDCDRCGDPYDKTHLGYDEETKDPVHLCGSCFLKSIQESFRESFED